VGPPLARQILRDKSSRWEVLSRRFPFTIRPWVSAGLSLWRWARRRETDQTLGCASRRAALTRWPEPRVLPEKDREMAKPAQAIAQRAGTGSRGAVGDGGQGEQVADCLLRGALRSLGPRGTPSSPFLKLFHYLCTRAGWSPTKWGRWCGPPGRQGGQPPSAPPPSRRDGGPARSAADRWDLRVKLDV